MENNSKPQGWGVRHTFLIMTFFLMFMNQCWRSNVSVAIVAMVKHGENETISTNVGMECPFYANNTPTTQVLNKPLSKTNDIVSRFVSGFIKDWRI